MTRLEFSEFCRAVAMYYGRDGTVNEKRLELWYDMCRQVPAETLGWIKEHVFAERDTMPPNLPKAIREGWDAWKNAHPTRLIREDIECEAPGCEDGWIRVIADDGYTSVAYCDRCALKRRLCKPGDRNLTNLAALEACGRRWFSPEMRGMRVDQLQQSMDGMH